MTRKEVIKFLVLRTIGNFLLLFAIFGVFATFGSALYYEAQYRVAQARGITFTISENSERLSKSKDQIVSEPEVQAPRAIGFGDILVGPREQALIPFDRSFSIVIPKIGASSLVFPNVDSTNQDEFLPVLQQGVAHTKGTVFPGMKGNTYLFAHSADNFWDVGRYNAVFYLLKDLSVEDEIVLFFEGKRFNYKVRESVIVEPSEVSFLVQSQEKNASEKLILQTCWPPGTTWKRLVVFAEPL